MTEGIRERGGELSEGPASMDAFVLMLGMAFQGVEIEARKAREGGSLLLAKQLGGGYQAVTAVH